MLPNTPNYLSLPSYIHQEHFRVQTTDELLHSGAQLQHADASAEQQHESLQALEYLRAELQGQPKVGPIGVATYARAAEPEPDARAEPRDSASPGTSSNAPLIFSAFAHMAAGCLVIELEPMQSELPPLQATAYCAQLSSLQVKLAAVSSEEDVTVILATQMQKFTGFDRCMVYRFDRDANGFVIAERNAPGVPRVYQGMSFPSTDIPAIARKMFLINRVRSIQSVHGAEAQLVPAINPATGQALPRHMANLRAHSKCHLEYLDNMGVTASLVAAIIVHGKLWGLCVCHHESGPRILPPSYRALCDVLASTAGYALERCTMDAKRRDIVRTSRLITAFRDTCAVSASLRAPSRVLSSKVLRGLNKMLSPAFVSVMDTRKLPGAPMFLWKADTQEEIIDSAAVAAMEQLQAAILQNIVRFSQAGGQVATRDSAKYVATTLQGAHASTTIASLRPAGTGDASGCAQPGALGAGSSPSSDAKGGSSPAVPGGQDVDSVMRYCGPDRGLHNTEAAMTGVIDKSSLVEWAGSGPSSDSEDEPRLANPALAVPPPQQASTTASPTANHGAARPVDEALPFMQHLATLQAETHELLQLAPSAAHSLTNDSDASMNAGTRQPVPNICEAFPVATDCALGLLAGHTSGNWDKAWDDLHHVVPAVPVEERRPGGHVMQAAAVHELTIAGQPVAGVLVATLCPGVHMFVWREEQQQHVRWSGDVRIAAGFKDHYGVHHPRGSFEEWQQLVRGHAAAWRASELLSVARFQHQAQDACARNLLQSSEERASEARKVLLNLQDQRLVQSISDISLLPPLGSMTRDWLEGSISQGSQLQGLMAEPEAAHVDVAGLDDDDAASMSLHSVRTAAEHIRAAYNKIAAGGSKLPKPILDQMGKTLASKLVCVADELLFRLQADDMLLVRVHRDEQDGSPRAPKVFTIEHDSRAVQLSKVVAPAFGALYSAVNRLCSTDGSASSEQSLVSVANLDAPSEGGGLHGHYLAQQHMLAMFPDAPTLFTQYGVQVPVLATPGDPATKRQLQGFARLPVMDELQLLILTFSPDVNMHEQYEFALQLHSAMQSLVSRAMTSLQQFALQLSEHERQLALEEARMKQDFVSKVSHELRTPFTGILSVLELLKATQLSQDQEELLGMAHDSTHSLLRLLNNVLDLAKMNATKMGSVKEPMRPSAVANSVLRSMCGNAELHGIELVHVVQPSVSLMWVLSDSDKYRQALMNLVGNALKFTPAGGYVEVHTELLEEEEAGDLLFQARVVDSGPGISTEQQQRLFLPFTSLEQVRTRTTSGTGLGLMLVKQYAALMGGTAWVKSKLGHGCTFGFTFRAGQVPDGSSQQGSSQSSRASAYMSATPGEPAPRLRLQDVGPNYVDASQWHVHIMGSSRTLHKLVTLAAQYLDLPHSMQYEEFGMHDVTRVGGALEKAMQEHAPEHRVLAVAEVDMNSPDLVHEALHLLQLLLPHVDQVLVVPIAHTAALHGSITTASYDADETDAVQRARLERIQAARAHLRVILTDMSCVTLVNYLPSVPELVVAVAQVCAKNRPLGDTDQSQRAEVLSKLAGLSEMAPPYEVSFGQRGSPAASLHTSTTRAPGISQQEVATPDTPSASAHGVSTTSMSAVNASVGLAGVGSLGSPSHTSLTTADTSAANFQEATDMCLVVDDTKVNRVVLAKLLGKCGYKSWKCADGVMGAQFIQRHHHQLMAVFMDLHMPRMDGRQATHIVREWEAANGKARLPIILCTADVLEAGAGLTVLEGQEIDAVLGKPLQTDHIEQVMTQCVHRQRASVSTFSRSIARAPEDPGAGPGTGIGLPRCHTALPSSSTHGATPGLALALGHAVSAPTPYGSTDQSASGTPGLSPFHLVADSPQHGHSVASAPGAAATHAQAKPPSPVPVSPSAQPSNTKRPSKWKRIFCCA